MIGYIYIITNLVNDKIYIGQHISPTFDIKYWGSGLSLENAKKKYGLENFARDIIEWCDTQEELDEKEKFYIKEYRSMNRNFGYNLCEGGEGSCGYHHTEEAKTKMSINHKGKSTWNKGKHMSEESKKKLSDKLKSMHRIPWNKGKVGVYSDEVRKRISETQKGKHSSPKTEFKKGMVPWNKGLKYKKQIAKEVSRPDGK